MIFKQKKSYFNFSTLFTLVMHLLYLYYLDNYLNATQQNSSPFTVIRTTTGLMSSIKRTICYKFLKQN
jgi:hypothetical protein